MSFEQLSRVQDPVAREALRLLQTWVQRWKGTAGQLSAPFPLSMSGQRLTGLIDPTDPSDAVSKGYADAHYGADVLRQSLQVGGATPLDLTGLPGVGEAVVMVGTHADRLLLDAGSTPEGTVFWETDRTAYYLLVSVSGVPVWKFTGGLPYRGTLSPDQKPADLGTNDAGFLFYSTDFARTYRWGGASWADAGFEEPRGMIAWAADPFAFTGITGWALADGSNVTASTTTGGTQSVTLPNLHQRFVRGVTASPGGTGGSATTHTHPVDPPNTTSGTPSTVTTGAPSATTAVQAGTGTTVASDTHTHDRSETHDVDIAQFNSGTPSGTGGDDALPPYTNELVYVRL